MIKREIQIALTALMFYTRINVGKWVNYQSEYAKLCTKYLPIIGWVVGGFSALFYLLFANFLPEVAAVILSLLASVFLTGGFHEDGLADTCDAFGGGWTKEKILVIMKDSTIGTYGALGLIFLIGLKISLLVEIYSFLNPFNLFLITIIAHSLSRFMATTFLVTHTYAGSAEKSKSKDMIQKTPLHFLLLPALFTVIPMLLLANEINSYLIFLLFIPTSLITFLLGRYFNKWIGGYTGDCLGATQQVTEVVIYITTLAIWPYI